MKCCDNPTIATGAPPLEDEMMKVQVVCGSCNKDFGEMPLPSAEALFIEMAAELTGVTHGN